MSEMETIGFVSGQSSTHKAPDIGKTFTGAFQVNTWDTEQFVRIDRRDLLGVYEERQCER